MVTAVATIDDLRRHDQPPHVMDALIDSIRCTAEADVACLLKQMAEQEWAVSLRSKGGSDVSAVAVALGGGGHKLAAGFTGRGSAAEVIREVRERLT
jgi:phosphoesterase RecJ-like protein